MKKLYLLLFTLVLALPSQAQTLSPANDGTITGIETYDMATTVPLVIEPFLGVSTGSIATSITISARADANGTGQGVEFFYDANFGQEERVFLHSFQNVSPGDYIISYAINADVASFSFESEIVSGSVTKTQTVGIQTNGGTFQTRYTPQLSVSSTGTVSFSMFMSPFFSAFTNSLVFIDDIQLIRMNEELVPITTCVQQVQEENFDTAVSPPASNGSPSFTPNVELSAAADINSTGQGVEFVYSASYGEVINSIDLVSFTNVSAGTYYIEYQYDDGNTFAPFDFSYYNRISSGASSSDNYIASAPNTGFVTHRTQEITISTTQSISIQLFLGETINNLTSGIPTYIDNVRLIQTGVSDASSPEIGVITNTTDFGNVSPGASSTLTYTIENTGGATLNIASITSDNNMLFSVSNIPTMIAIGASATFDVIFSPTMAGAASATITINSDDCDEGNLSFSVSGTGASAVIPEVSFGLVQSTGNEDDATTFVFSLSASASLTSDLSVNFSVSGTAIFNEDYYLIRGSNDFNGTSGTMIISAGATSTDLVFQVQQDAIVEPDETIIVTIDNP